MLDKVKNRYISGVYTYHLEIYSITINQIRLLALFFNLSEHQKKTMKQTK